MTPRVTGAAGWRRGPLHLEGRVSDPGEGRGGGRGGDPGRGGRLGQLRLAQPRLVATAALLLLGLLSTFSTTVLKPDLGRKKTLIIFIVFESVFKYT